MKNVLRLPLLFALIALAVSSCKKFEEGPKLSLKKDAKRLAGRWVPSQFVDSNGTVDNDVADEEQMTFTEDGGVTLHTNGLGDLTGTWTFNDDHTELTTSYTILGITSTNTMTVIKLKNKELGLRESDNDVYYYTKN